MAWFWKIREQDISSLFLNSILYNEGRKPEDNSSMRSLDQKCSSRIPSQYNNLWGGTAAFHVILSSAYFPLTWVKAGFFLIQFNERRQAFFKQCHEQRQVFPKQWLTEAGFSPNSIMNGGRFPHSVSWDGVRFPKKYHERKQAFPQ